MLCVGELEIKASSEFLEKHARGVEFFGRASREGSAVVAGNTSENRFRSSFDSHLRRRVSLPGSGIAIVMRLARNGTGVYLAYHTRYRGSASQQSCCPESRRSLDLRALGGAADGTWLAR